MEEEVLLIPAISAETVISFAGKVVVELSASEKVNGSWPLLFVVPLVGDRVYWDSDSDREREAFAKYREGLE